MYESGYDVSICYVNTALLWLLERSAGHLSWNSCMLELDLDNSVQIYDRLEGLNVNT